MEKRKIIYNGKVVDYAGRPGLYQELTAEQEAFFAEHPAASVAEVLACALTPAPPASDLDEYKEQARRRLREIVSTHLHAKVDHDKLQEALVIKMTGVETETVSMQIAEDLINYYNRMTAMLKTYTLDTYLKIHECTGVEQVDGVMNRIDVQSLTLL